MIATVKDSVCELLAPNQVIYRDAFDGLKADMRYTYGKGFFEAEAILRESPVLPDGFKPESTVLQVVTEFIDPPTPNVSKNTFRSANNFDAVDDFLIDFGGMMMVPGKGFSVNETTGASDGQNNSTLYVRKQWQQINGRQMLIESLPWTELEAQLKPLSKSEANETKSTRQASIERELPIKPLNSSVSTPVRVASLPYSERGFAIDYLIVVTQSGWTFQTGQTYLVPGGVTISSSATFQSGAIIKFDRNGQLTLTGMVSCPTDGSVFLTARDDTSIGEDTSTGTLSGYYGNTHYIQLYNTTYAAVFRKLNVRYATEGVFAYTPNVSNTVRDSRFENCQTAVGAYSGTMTLTNLIMCNDSIQYSNHGNAYIYVCATTTNCDGSARFTTLTDGKVLSGITNLPVEVVTGDNLLESVYLNDIGNPVNGFTFNSNYTTATWNTAFTTNGSYTLTPIAHFQDDTVVYGPTNTVIVTNFVRFPNCWPVAGEAMRIEAQTFHTNGTWQMDVYDDQNNHLSTLQGNVDGNGYCNLSGFAGPGFSLSLMDNNGSQLPYTFYVVNVTTFAAAGSGQTPSQSSGKVTNFVERSWWSGVQTYFNVAYQQIYTEQSQNALNLRVMITSLVQAAISRYPNLDPNPAVIRGIPDVPFVLAGPSDWGTLALDLTTNGARNLYYFGHGGPDHFGYSVKTIGNTNQQINMSDLRRILKNAPDPLKGTNGYPYRFVF